MIITDLGGLQGNRFQAEPRILETETKSRGWVSVSALRGQRFVYLMSHSHRDTLQSQTQQTV